MALQSQLIIAIAARAASWKDNYQIYFAKVLDLPCRNLDSLL
jgi:hypothetical protein